MLGFFLSWIYPWECKVYMYLKYLMYKKSLNFLKIEHHLNKKGKMIFEFYLF